MAMLIDICNIFLFILSLVILLRVIVSWIPHNPNQPFFRYLFSVTEPLLKPFRFARVGMMDLSPLLLFLVIDIVRRILLTLK
ncbi:MAG: YggT family protein [Gracilibacteraceae bacterium]|jgi:YggT family protein|nr:YggT family protein [Gracilibacteraceae bacterium]